MQFLRLHDLFKAHASLKSFCHILEQQPEDSQLTDMSFQQLTSNLNDLGDLLAECGMPVSLGNTREVVGLLVEAREAPCKIWQEPIGQLLNTLRHEMRTVTAWRVPAEKVVFLNPEPFGPEVHKRFLSATHDIEEAGKCLTFGRNTATVFHLMRVMETGLRALGRSLNDPSLDPKRNPSWETILRKCDQELQKPIKDRSAEWATDDAFFSTATANLRVVKDAWRNPTMHVERVYDEDLARGAWNATRAFMRHLATKLSETKDE